MRIKSIWLRRIHKWVGLAIGLQFLLWAVSGAAMALLDMEAVAGGQSAHERPAALVASPGAWPRVQQALAGQKITALSLRPLPWGQMLQVTTAQGVALFDPADGQRVPIDRAKATAIARSAHPERATVTNAVALRDLPLAVRGHELPIWQIDFADAGHSSYYVSGTTGAILERRNDSWRWWDLFWMLHTMDYAERTSFNHPLIVLVGIAMAWLALTGVWLLFRTTWRHDFAWARRSRRPARHP
ncbi:PepSY domain-containing protein [Sphingomonas sp. GCM10030256]|uniref:PepSY domain-containing protein n=1 Tax=Sphingomonas sp. GCM10030256 TaxID=3273427 RepID=UPI00360C860B